MRGHRDLPEACLNLIGSITYATNTEKQEQTVSATLAAPVVAYTHRAGRDHRAAIDDGGYRGCVHSRIYKLLV